MAKKKMAMSGEVAKALARISGGLYVVTAGRGGARGAMIASWVAQASFEPLGLSIAVAKDRAIESLMQVWHSIYRRYPALLCLLLYSAAPPLPPLSWHLLFCLVSRDCSLATSNCFVPVGVKSRRVRHSLYANNYDTMSDFISCDK